MARGRGHLHDVIARSQIGEVINAIRAGGDVGHRVAVDVVRGRAVAVEQAEHRAFDRRLAIILHAVRVQVQPHQAAQGDRFDETEVHGHVAVGVGVAILVGAAVGEDLARGLQTVGQIDYAAAVHAGVGLAGDVGVGVVIVVGIGHLRRGGDQSGGRGHLHDVIARGQIGEVIDAVRAGGDVGHGIAVDIVGGIARAIQQGDGGVFDARFTTILHAIAVQVGPNQAAQGDGLHEAEVHGHVAVIVGVAVLVGRTIGKDLIDGLLARN